MARSRVLSYRRSALAQESIVRSICPGSNARANSSCVVIGRLNALLIPHHGAWCVGHSVRGYGSYCTAGSESIDRITRICYLTFLQKS